MLEQKLKRLKYHFRVSDDSIEIGGEKVGSLKERLTIFVILAILAFVIYLLWPFLITDKVIIKFTALIVILLLTINKIWKVIEFNNKHANHKLILRKEEMEVITKDSKITLNKDNCDSVVSKVNVFSHEYLTHKGADTAMGLLVRTPFRNPEDISYIGEVLIYHHEMGEINLLSFINEEMKFVEDDSKWFAQYFNQHLGKRN